MATARKWFGGSSPAAGVTMPWRSWSVSQAKAMSKRSLMVISRCMAYSEDGSMRIWDGQIRMDPSSEYAMQRLITIKDRFDIAFACDTDHDRHGIVTPAAGLLPPNHFLAVAIDYLFG